MSPIRDVPTIWDAWSSGVYTGDRKPATRVTVEKGWLLRPSEAVLGTWTRGPARWYVAEDHSVDSETEIPSVVSVNLSRSLDSDSGSCEIVVRNQGPISLTRENPQGQFGDPGYFTWDHGMAQEAKARWNQFSNSWNEVLVPNALIRTYQGFGGHDKTIGEAIRDENIVLNGVWLIDDVTVTTDGSLNIKCRDMAKLLIDQQLFPPLVPSQLYPLDYRRWIIKTVALPVDPNPTQGDVCFPCTYIDSSTDQVYGEVNTGATGHRPQDAFDISYEAGDPNSTNTYAHQKTYWLSEPKGAPTDSVWIEFAVAAGEAGDINRIYYHPWKGVIEGRGVHRIMVSVFENGQWAPAENQLGGMTPDGLPYVCTFTPGTELAPATATQLNDLPRDYRATKIRLTITQLIWADDFPYGYGDPDNHGGGYRAGARKIMACFGNHTASTTRIPPLVFAGASIPKNTSNRLGYWQVKANGQVVAFGDARTYQTTSPTSLPASTVVGMSAHPGGVGYWFVDITGRVVSAGAATHFGDLSGLGLTDVVDIAPTRTGDGYILLRNNGMVYTFGDGIHSGDSAHSGALPSGVPAVAKSIETHPSVEGYWVLWTDGFVDAHGLAHHGNALRPGFNAVEYVTALRRTSTGNGYWIVSGAGHMQGFGDAQAFGDLVATGYEDENWYKGIVWDFLPSPAGDGAYALQTADGKLWTRRQAGFSTGLEFGSVGSGQAIIRSDGNYLDYSDIIRDLLLWAGFYLYSNPAPPGERPAVYGNIETTGAWAESPLPRAMFDKKPVSESIKEIRDIVGYTGFVDAEGGYRFESPNWWAPGNWLPESLGGQRVPYNHMPEIDETVQLLDHSVTRSAKDARSRLIITTADPYPVSPGKTVPKEVVTTEITPMAAADLRGLVVPAMWINGHFLNKFEQQVMADLVDLRMWFGRRMANLSCVANPLIDINDQVRVIERTTGEVFIHYIRGISVSHDLMSGDFRMQLTTHWLAGSPYGKRIYYMAAAMHPAGSGYWQVAMNGDVYAYGEAEIYESHQRDSHLGWISGMASTPSGLGYYTVDQTGKVLTYGDAEHQGDAHPTTYTDAIPASVPINDMAVTNTGGGYYLLEQNGVVHCFGDAVFYGQTTNGGRKIPSGSLVYASAIETHPVTGGYWVLWSDGRVDAFNLPHYGNAAVDDNEPDETFTAIRRIPDGTGYFIVAGGGDNVQAFGGAAYLGASVQYPRDQWSEGLVWDILVHPDGGYALQRANGNLEPFGFTLLGTSSPAPSEIMWAIVSPEAHEGLADPTIAYGVSAELMGFLAGTGSPSANNAVVNNFAAPDEDVIRGSA